MSQQTLADAYLYAYSSNQIYTDNKARWQFLLESYLGGLAYRKGGHLVKYQLESNAEYAQRLSNTPLDNHCKSVISTYISFLFREEAEREFGPWGMDPSVQAFLEDADLEGSELDDFMKQVSTWSLVFGHSWVIMTKPNIGALTRADEIAAGVRPYVSLLTPLTVLDWRWTRKPSGYYELSYFKYIEDANDSVTIIREWTKEEIKTYTIDERSKEGQVTAVEVNELGEIPAVICYAQRGLVRGLGSSVIDDIADMQRAIYNELSEVEQTIRLEGHPSLVVTPDIQAGNGAGSMIVMPNDLDPGLKPYLLTVDAVPVDQIYKSIQNRVEAIDKMANTGSVRAVESRKMSGVAMETEFQLLNAKLSEIADNIELCEKQMWYYFCQYQGLDYTYFDVEYPDSFSIRDMANEYTQLKDAKAAATSPDVLAVIDLKLRELLDDPRLEQEDYGEEMEVESDAPFVPHTMVNPATGETRYVTTPEQHNQATVEGFVHPES